METLSKCCNMMVRWLDCAACENDGKVCEVLVCSNCGEDAE